MLSLIKKNENTVLYNNRTVAINLAFDIVLKCYEIEANKMLDDVAKVVLFAELLIVDLSQYEGIFDINNLAEIVKLAFQKISITKGENGENEQLEPLFDYTEDAERIYASFKAVYDMDLIAEQGKLQWGEFIALFNNLPQESPIMQAVYYRGCELPKGAENKEERKRIQKLKRHYELSYQRKKREQAMVEAMKKQLEAARE